jgi:hypothetical protein
MSKIVFRSPLVTGGANHRTLAWPIVSYVYSADAGKKIDD